MSSYACPPKPPQTRRPKRPGTLAPPACTPSTTPYPASAPSPARGRCCPPWWTGTEPPTPRPTPGPPLGLGGLPFEAAEFDLQEGSLIALYTDGLLEARPRHRSEYGPAPPSPRPARPLPASHVRHRARSPATH
ncbi:SpoIIE family protein phosphatase [Streptomyces sp. NPDC005349]|uniref:SpoIIE family protein phosphatase n=1 Tax=Streptomyces sp. NPDC005349 TaxID=3157037 RepID=UPI0033B9C3A6